MQGLLADCRHAIRLYRRTPMSSLIAVVVLAIGMAFVSAFVSLYVDLVVKPHPGFEDSGPVDSDQVPAARLRLNSPVSSTFIPRFKLRFRSAL